MHPEVVNVRNLATGVSLFLILVATAVPAAAQDELTGPFVAVEGHQSLLTGVANRTLLNVTAGGGLRAGYRWDGWGVFAHFEQNLWQTTEMDSKIVQGAFNLGVGGEYIYADGFVRTSLEVGPSILLFDTLLDDAGSVGVFVDLRPVGLRWNPWEKLHIVAEPLTLAFVAPVLDGIPLIQVEYRSVLGVEWAF